MNVPFCVQSHILATLASGEDAAWEYDPHDCTLIVDLHKLLVPVHYDDEEQMSTILAHIHLGAVNHLVIHAYVESCTQDAYDRRSMTLYHPIDIGCFLELDDLVRNPPSEVHVTCRFCGDVDDIVSKLVQIMLFFLLQQVIAWQISSWCR